MIALIPPNAARTEYLPGPTPSDASSVLSWHVRCVRQGQPSAVILDGRALQSTCESGARAGYDRYKRKRGSKVHMAVDTLGQLLAVSVTPANEQERAQVAELARQAQQATGHTVKLAFADQGTPAPEKERAYVPSLRPRRADGTFALSHPAVLPSAMVTTSALRISWLNGWRANGCQRFTACLATSSA